MDIQMLEVTISIDRELENRINALAVAQNRPVANVYPSLLHAGLLEIYKKFPNLDPEDEHDYRRDPVNQPDNMR